MAIFIEHPCERIPVAQPHARVHPAIGAGAWVLIAAVLGSAMPSIDGTAVNVILPLVQRDLHADARGVQWIVEGYALFLSALILVGGGLGDVYGRRRIFVIGTAMFGVSSIACAASTSMAELIGARCLQGLSAALLVPESLALISAQFDEGERGKAIGTWSAFSAMSTAVGPVLGGYRRNIYRGDGFSLSTFLSRQRSYFSRYGTSMKVAIPARVKASTCWAQHLPRLDWAD